MSLTGVYEHGILMNCSDASGEKHKTSLCYWVVGYVCSTVCV